MLTVTTSGTVFFFKLRVQVLYTGGQTGVEPGTPGPLVAWLRMYSDVLGSLPIHAA